MSKPTESDLEWLRENYRSLFYFRSGGSTIIEGTLSFSRAYKGVTRTDAYSISIDLPDVTDKLPKVFEKGGRLKSVQEKHGLKKLADLHCYSSGELCLAAPQQLTLTFLPKPSLSQLIEVYVVPFFYSQSYYEEYTEWPWPHLPHDARGLLAWFHENADMSGAASETIKELRKLKTKAATETLARGARADSFNPRARCLCGRKKSYLECHPRLVKLAFDIRSTTPHRGFSKRKKRVKRRRR